MDERRAPVAVLMPSLPERAALRTEALRCFADQTLPPAQIVLVIDHHRAGVVPTLNAAAAQALETGVEWLLPSGDDDLYDLDEIEVLLDAAAGDRADIVYGWPRCTGDPRVAERVHCVPFDPAVLRNHNIVSGHALIRASLWRALGGQRVPSSMIRYEDWDFFLRALNAGARFHCVERTTFTYRLDPTWEHLSAGRAR